MTYMSEIAMPQVRGALLGAFALSFGLGQLFNAVGFQILAEVSQQLAIRSWPYFELTSSDKPREVLEWYLLSVRHAWSIRHCHSRYSRVPW